MNKEDYKLVVKTDCWKLRREAYLQGHKWCEVCGNSRPEFLEVHHLTYERIGNELDKDLVSVCSMCHSLLHGLLVDPRAYAETALSHLQGQLVNDKRNFLRDRIVRVVQDFKGISKVAGQL